MDSFLKRAIEQASEGLLAGGIPIGSVLVIDDKDNQGCGHNQRVQKKSPILHAEMDCLENAGRLKSSETAGDPRSTRRCRLRYVQRGRSLYNSLLGHWRESGVSAARKTTSGLVVLM